MLETTILDQVRSVFQHLEARYVFHITYHPGHEQAQELIGFLKDVASCSDKLSCRMSEIENPVLEFTLLKDDVETGIKFRGIPGGHEFTSLLLAVLNADGKGKNLPDESIGRRIRALKGTKICRTKQFVAASGRCKATSACKRMYRLLAPTVRMWCRH